MLKSRHDGAVFLEALLCLALNWGCSTDAPVAGGGTETGDAAVVGVLYNPTGSPAAGAAVRFIPADRQPVAPGLANSVAAAPESTVTNNSGLYTLDSLPAGTYNVLASGGGNLAYQDSVEVVADSQTQVPPDTLKAPGSVRGAVELQPGDDARTVFLLVMGTNTWAGPDSAGAFALSDMAEGTYHIRILTTLDDYLPLDTTLSITAGRADTLASTIKLRYTGIPIPEGLTIEYDPLSQLVTLTWNTPTTGRAIQGYNVYRKHADSTSFMKIAGVLADTFFVDSTAAQDQIYEYRISAADSQQTEGTMSTGYTVSISAAFTLLKTIGARQEIDPGRYGLLISGDTLFASNKQDKLVELFDTAGTLLSYLDTTGSRLQEPYDIAQSGLEIIVADNTSELKVFGADGSYTMSITIEGSKAKYLYSYSPDSLYIVDAQANKLYLIDSSGTKLDSSDQQFGQIRDVIVIASGEVVASDSRDRTLTFFTPSLELSEELTVEPQPTTPLAGGGNRANQISAIAEGEDGVLFVGVSVDTGMVYLLERQRGVIGKFTVYSGPSDFNRAAAIAISSNGLAYISVSDGTILVYGRK